MTCKWQHDGKLIGTFENIDHGTMVLLELAGRRARRPNEDEMSEDVG
jgi:hypothetical protein